MYKTNIKWMYTTNIKASRQIMLNTEQAKKKLECKSRMSNGITMI